MHIELIAKQQEIKKLENYIKDFMRKVNNEHLQISDPKKAYEGINKLEQELNQFQKILNSLRKDLSIQPQHRSKGRDNSFESNLGRVGQLRGELARLQQLLNTLRDDVIPDIRNKIVDTMNHPLQQTRNLQKLAEQAGKFIAKTTVKQPPNYDAIQNPVVDSPGLLGPLIVLIGILQAYRTHNNKK